MSFRSPLFIACGCLALFGFGCKPDPVIPPRTLPTSPSAQTPSIPGTPTIPGMPKENGMQTVREALTALDRVTSFRVALVAETPEGAVAGDTVYAKNKGAHGTIIFPGQLKTEFYELPDLLWFRFGTSTWTHVTNTPDILETVGFTKAQRAFMSTSSSMLAEGTTLVDIQEDRGCRMYVLERESSDGTDTSQVCIKDGRPVYMSGTSLTRKIELRFSEYDKPVTLQAPR